MLDSYENKKKALLVSALSGVLGAAGVLFYHFYNGKNLLRRPLPEIPRVESYAMNEVTQKVLIASVYGLLAAGVGVLLSPKSGRYLRRDILDTVLELKEKSQQLASGVGKQGEEIIDGLGSQANSIVNQTKKVMKKLAGQFSENPQGKAKGRGKFKANHVLPEKFDRALELLSLGVSLWHSLSPRKKNVTRH